MRPSTESCCEFFFAHFSCAGEDRKAAKGRAHRAREPARGRRGRVRRRRRWWWRGEAPQARRPTEGTSAVHAQVPESLRHCARIQMVSGRIAREWKSCFRESNIYGGNRKIPIESVAKSAVYIGTPHSIPFAFLHLGYRCTTTLLRLCCLRGLVGHWLDGVVVFVLFLPFSWKYCSLLYHRIKKLCLCRSLATFPVTRPAEFCLGEGAFGFLVYQQAGIDQFKYAQGIVFKNLKNRNVMSDGH